jgi:hypothetical protein
VVRGGDPAGEKLARRRAATVAELCDDYMDVVSQGRLLTRRGSSKKSSTIATDRSRIESHIKPLLGARKVPEVRRSDVERFMYDIAAGKTHRRIKMAKPRAVSNVRGSRGAATRTVGLLGAIFTYAVRQGLRSDNPVIGVIRFADGKRDRRLSNAEYRKLGDGIKASESVWPFATSAVRFLALTGWLQARYSICAGAILISNIGRLASQIRRPVQAFDPCRTRPRENSRRYRLRYPAPTTLYSRPHEEACW